MKNGNTAYGQNTHELSGFTSANTYKPVKLPYVQVAGYAQI